MAQRTSQAKLTMVRKRNGEMVKFNEKKIAKAVHMAMKATEEGSEREAKDIAKKVKEDILQVLSRHKSFVPDVEGIQDSVEKELILAHYVKTAKEYILYRQKHADDRKVKVDVPKEVSDLVKDGRKYFRNPMAEFVYYRSYSKWIAEKNRRETWIETVNRYMDFMEENLGKKLSTVEYDEVRQHILEQKAMPSMRLFWAAGDAARATNVCAYNCSFIAPSKLQDFGEIMYISMCGTGVGFSVERTNVEKLPQIEKQKRVKKEKHVVKDSKEGWADAFVLGLKKWFGGEDVTFDFSELRAEGARLKTMGGKSSGPKPLMELMDFAKKLILGKQGRRLSPIEVHDLVCKIGEIVVSGGVRRSALISLSDLDDSEMRNAKNGQFYITDPQRGMANNSTIYDDKPGNIQFMEEWMALMKSGSGERGIFNRGSLEGQLPKRRWDVFKDHVHSSGTNPCGEIILRSKQFCNLSEVVARSNDTEETLLKKIRVATIIGTYQSSLTKFGYLSKEWKKNCEEERLLGVSVTGIWDSKSSRSEEVLRKLRAETVKVNKKYAKKFKIGESTCITCVKPSGTVSQLVDASSGMHPRHAKYYIRRIRISSTDALFKMLRDQGVSYNPEVGQSMDTANTYVFDFPIKAPSGSVFKDDQTSIEQLEHWKNVKNNYTEHNPSVTVSVGDDEWIQTANWVYENWDIVGGLSFLPRSNHVYALAPYEAIDKVTYEKLAGDFPKIDFSQIVSYEIEDETKGSKELACMGGTCEIF
jgi:ribonucleoside-triphosphate reductase (thioredoxin)